MMNIPFIDLKAQQERIRPQVDQAVAKVLNHGAYCMGPEVFEFEKQLSEFSGSPHVVSCSSGTDALTMLLMAKEIGPGDAVFVPAFTFVATAEVVALRGATPVFVDVLPDTFNLDVESLKKAIPVALEAGLTPRGVIVVDLFGQPADYDAITPVAHEHGLWVLDDAAQSFGATYKGKAAGHLAEMNTTSFFPAKPLGCYGDGGAIFVNDPKLEATLQSIRVHGQGTDKYENVRLGVTGRLDTMQAAILIEKMAIFEEELRLRQTVAERYNEGLEDVCEVPYVIEGAESAWAQYTIKVDPAQRAHIINMLKEAGVPSVIYYVIPLHQQEAYKHYPRATESLPVSEALSQQVMSLPMHPYLDEKTQDFIIDTFHSAFARQAA